MSHSFVGKNAHELAALIRRGEASAREVTADHIAHIEAVNPALNALVVPLFEEAAAVAAQADEAQAAGRELGPLHGVPISVKECFHVAGTQATMGLTSLVGQLSGEDGPLVARLKGAGAIVLGKTNVPQLMLFHETDNPVYGRTNHPHNPLRTCGGSSGGEAALIAADGSPLGLANDLGGSIRIPAHFCGICGIKPSSHRLTRRGSVANLRGMEVIQAQPGPLARSVEDLELALSVLTGDAADFTEPFVAPAALRPSRAVELHGLRVGYWEDNGFFPYAPAVRRAVREAVAVLARAGAKIVPFAPPRIAEAMYLFTAILGADGAADCRRLVEGSTVDARLRRLLTLGGVPNFARGALARGLTWWGQASRGGLVRSARPRTADEYWQLTLRVQSYRERFLTEFARACDCLILPPYALPALLHDQALDLIPAASDCMLINLLGLPSGVVPVTSVRANEESDRPASHQLTDRVAREAEQGSAGLPIGVQVVSHYWREDIVLAVMRAIEDGRANNSA